MDIEFLPTSGIQRNISNQLIESLKSCQAVKASVAFWSLDVQALGGRLLQALQKPESELYVDMQWPTDFTKLSDFYENIKLKSPSPTLFICLRKHRDTEGSGLSGLLHTKLLLFDMGRGYWEIWVGSHNFTQKAISGINLEASLRIKGNISDSRFKELVQQVEEYLRYIRKLCQPFDPQKVFLYESLRKTRSDKELLEILESMLSEDVIVDNIIIRRILTLKSKEADKLAGQTIILLGNLSKELSYITYRNRGGKPILLRVRDIKTDQEYTYIAKLRPFDTIDNDPSKNVSFNDRRWAVRKVKSKGQKIDPPVLEPAQDVTKALIETNKYYVNFDIGDILNHEVIRYYTYPETDTAKLWRIDPETSPIEEIDLLGLRGSEKNWVELPEYMIPVENAEQLTSIHPVEWGDYFVDGLLERRIVVLGKPKNKTRKS
jgi:HKD family nuclease